jgi:hypothetical protein
MFSTSNSTKRILLTQCIFVQNNILGVYLLIFMKILFSPSPPPRQNESCHWGEGGREQRLWGEEHVAGRWDKALTQLVRYINKKDDILFTKKKLF